MTERSPWWSIALIVTGIAFCLYGISLPFHPVSTQAEHNKSIIDNGRPSPATIQSVKKTMKVNPEAPLSEPTLMEDALVSFSANGNTFEFKALRPVDVESWERDQQVEVIYLPDNPREAVLNERGVPGVGNILMKQFYYFGPGILVSIIGVLFLLRRR